MMQRLPKDSAGQHMPQSHDLAHPMRVHRERTQRPPRFWKEQPLLVVSLVSGWIWIWLSVPGDQGSVGS